MAVTQHPQHGGIKDRTHDPLFSLLQENTAEAKVLLGLGAGSSMQFNALNFVSSMG